LEEVERRTYLVQMRQVARQVEQPLEIPEVRPDDPSDRCDAFRRMALEQRSGRDDEIPEPGWNPVLEVAKHRQDLFTTPQFRQRDRDDVGELRDFDSRHARVVALEEPRVTDARADLGLEIERAS